MVFNINMNKRTNISNIQYIIALIKCLSELKDKNEI